MSKKLQELLGNEFPLLSLHIDHLEKGSGHIGADIRLTADIAAGMRQGLIELGLRPDDITGHELYAGLLSRAARDNQLLATRFGGNDPDDVQEMLPLIVRAVAGIGAQQKSFMLKRSVAKRLLKELPPAKLMRALGYRSVDSMLKHEHVEELYVVARITEDAVWLQKHAELIRAQIRPSDFEMRVVSLNIVREKFIKACRKCAPHAIGRILYVLEMGAVIIFPPDGTKLRGFTLSYTVALLHAFTEVRSYASFLKLSQVRPQFSELIAHTIFSEEDLYVPLASQRIHWRSVQRHFGIHAHPSVFEPHVQRDDIMKHTAPQLLSQLEPSLDFWVDTSHVGTIHNGVQISCNVSDVSYNYSHGFQLENAIAQHLKQSIWQELLERYLQSAQLQNHILHHLDF